MEQRNESGLIICYIWCFIILGNAFESSAMEQSIFSPVCSRTARLFLSEFKMHEKFLIDSSGEYIYPQTRQSLESRNENLLPTLPWLLGAGEGQVVLC